MTCYYFRLVVLYSISWTFYFLIFLTLGLITKTSEKRRVMARVWVACLVALVVLTSVMEADALFGKRTKVQGEIQKMLNKIQEKRMEKRLVNQLRALSARNSAGVCYSSFKECRDSGVSCVDLCVSAGT